MRQELVKQDREAGLQGRSEGGKFVAVYDPIVGFEIVERLAGGELLRDILVKGSGLPSPQTFRRWVANNPSLAKAYTASIQLSAASLEEEALDMGRRIAHRPKDGTTVRATEVAMNQLRWSAARRDPHRYGDRGNQQVVVPIQINTTLDLGNETAGGTTEHPNIYELQGTVTRDAPDTNDTGPVIHPDPPKRPHKITLTPRVKVEARTPFGKMARGINNVGRSDNSQGADSDRDEDRGP